MSELWGLSAGEAAAAVARRDISAAEIVTACLARIEEREPVVHAWVHLDRDLALRQAAACDAEPPRGPLHGVPVGVKDIIDTADQPTAYGSSAYAGHRPPADAVCVRRLREAGAVVLGKTVTTEFALFHPGPTANPHDPSRTPGGSSSGSAAAVADGHVPVALATQTAGSITRPAAFCGVFGLKPTFDRLDRTGVNPTSPTLDTLGVLARDAADLGPLAAVLAGEPVDAFDPGRDPLPDKPRIGFVRTAHWGACDPDARERIETAVERLAGDATVEEVTLPAGLVEAQTTIMLREVADCLAPQRHAHGEALSAQLRALLDEGAAVTDGDHRAALALAGDARERLVEVFVDHDVLLAPAVRGEAPVGLNATGDPLLCRAWTLLGAPTVAVPGLTGAAGLPLGVQVAAPAGRDDLALAAARWIAERLPVAVAP